MKTIRSMLLKGILILTLQPGLGVQSQDLLIHTDSLVAPLPDILTGDDGTIIDSPELWEANRRGEILELFRDHVYGRVPDMNIDIASELVYEDREALGGNAIQKEVSLELSNGSHRMDVRMLIFLPKDRQGPVPLFLGLNFYGNHTIHADPGISITESWVRNNEGFGITDNRATEASRGVRSGRWPVEMILARGYGLATIYYGDIDPDFDDGFKNGVHGLTDPDGSERDSSSWASVAAWAWGLFRAMDYFERDVDIDQDRVAVMGHSRLGKTSLWAGARDERFALVISNNSGCGGAALSRRPFGERVSRINEVFPHWFASRFHDYGDNEAALPVDQHMLMALVAPRPLYVASAEEDDWADQRGEYLSLFYGSEVYRLYDRELALPAQMPTIDSPVESGCLGYHIRTGKHDVTRYDWEQYLDFADQHLQAFDGGDFENPVSMEWIEERLVAEHPRLILTPELESQVRKKLESGDTLLAGALEMMRRNAESMLELEPLVRKMTGRRLLGVSREAIRRMSTLALVYRFERDQRYLDRLEEELRAVCGFEDWNPSHFLDVAEMATAVSLAVDWAGEWLSPDMEKLARRALAEKALKPGLATTGQNWWIDAENNWNLVCHGGLSLAALTVFEDEPELASAILHQAVEHIPLALEPYAPEGIYPEGPSYWFYATSYLCASISAFESALGCDFEFSSAPGVMESAVFSQVMAGPSGDYFDFFDSGAGGFHSLTHFGLLSWFAKRSGDGLDWEALSILIGEQLDDPVQLRGTRLYPVHFLSLAELAGGEMERFTWPGHWSGGGEEPVVILRDSENVKDGFFLAAKGGMASDNHGNMDAGTFVFELNGVRWSVDPGNQNYNALEQVMGGALWNSAQDSRRWTLLSKSSYGHSVLIINEEMHLVDGRAKLVKRDGRGAHPEYAFDLTPLYGNNIEKAVRSFGRISETCLGIRDELEFSEQTESLIWQMITRAEVKVKKDRLILQQDGATLYLKINSEVPFDVQISSLSPPPLSIDKDIPGLKRIGIKWMREDFTSDAVTLSLELDSEE